MKEIYRNAVEKYQCSGCYFGSGIDENCYQKGAGVECDRNRPGTFNKDTGFFFLGLPVGFNRIGPHIYSHVYIFPTLADGWEYNNFNIPVWKHLTDEGHTIIRGISPRTNYSWIHIYLTDCVNGVACAEITEEDLELMN